VLEACRLAAGLVTRVVVASSDKAYGVHERLPYTEDAELRGRAPYDASKAAAELIAKSYFATFGVPLAIARCANLYGPGDLNWNRLVPGTIRSALRGENPVLRSDGTLVRDWLFVEDAVEAYLALADALPRPGIAGEAFNFGNGAPLTVLDLVARILAITGRERARADGPRVLRARDPAPVPRLHESAHTPRLGAAPIDRRRPRADDRLVPRAPRALAEPPGDERTAPEEAEARGERARRERQRALRARVSAEPRERPARETREDGHPEHGAASEQRDGDEAQRRRRKLREGERRQRAAAREPVHDADEQRSLRRRPAQEVHVRGLPHGAVDRAHAEAEEQDRDAELEDLGEPRGHLRAQEGERQADREQRRRVSESPPGSESRAGASRALFGDERRDGGEVIGLERVPHPERDAQETAEESLEHQCGTYFAGLRSKSCLHCVLQK
jgi:hypothetical protein